MVELRLTCPRSRLSEGTCTSSSTTSPFCLTPGSVGRFNPGALELTPLEAGVASLIDSAGAEIQGALGLVSGTVHSFSRSLGLPTVNAPGAAGNRRAVRARSSSRGGFQFASLSITDGAFPEPSQVMTNRRHSGSSEPGRGVQLATADSAATPLPKPFLKSVLDGMLAGATAGVTVETALYPIDTIKTRLQAATKGGPIVFKGLYSGLSSNLMGVLPASAVFVGVYEPLKQRLLRLFPDNWSAAAHLSAGAAGGAAASFIRVPTEVVKQRMQTGQFKTAAGAVSQILSREGPRGLYAGYGSFLLRDLPFDALQFAIYEQLKIALKAAVKRDLKDPEMAAMGAISGALTGAITTPLDVIKTRLMVQGTSAKYKGIFDCVAKICAEEGSATLFRGVGPRVLWIGIGGSIFFGVLEKSKQFLDSVPQGPPIAAKDLTPA